MMMWTGRKPAAGRKLALLAVAASLLSPLPSSAGRLVCWNDENGNRACGDAVPPQYAKKERHVIDGVGRTREVLPAQMTPEQRAAAEERERVQAQQKLEAEQQAARDRALLQTYTEPQELVSLRNDRLATLDTRTELTQSAAVREASSLASLRRRLPEPGSGEKAPPKLLADIARFEEQVKDNERAVGNLVAKRAEICSDFARDIRRFQELKSGRAEFESPCPPPGAFSPKEEVNVDLAGARAFFDRWVEQEREFSAAYLDHYAKDAVIRQRVLAEGAIREQREVTAVQFREQVQKMLPHDKERLDTETYSAIQVVAEPEGRVKVYAIRTSDRTRESAPFEMTLQPKGKDWEIVEQAMQVAAQQ